VAGPAGIALVVAVTSALCTELGLVIGAISLRVRESATLCNVVFLVLLVFCGVNDSLDDLPGLDARGRQEVSSIRIERLADLVPDVHARDRVGRGVLVAVTALAELLDESRKGGLPTELRAGFVGGRGLVE
jgi:hypothetical protein